MTQQRQKVLLNRQPAFESRLQLMRNDHTSPSLTLGHQAIDLAEDWLDAGLPPEPLAQELRSMHPHLALVSNIAQILEEKEPNTLSLLRQLRESLREGNRHIAEKLAELVAPNPTIITLSNSATVCDALVHLNTSVVYLVDSRPGVESDQMAEQLRRRLRRAEREAVVHLVEATTIGNVVPYVDCGVLGTDSISRSGAVLHKVGTLPLALCCRHFGKPFYALGHSLKQIDGELDETFLSEGVLEAQAFDVTPAELITFVVTERMKSVAGTAGMSPREQVLKGRLRELLGA